MLNLKEATFWYKFPTPTHLDEQRQIVIEGTINRDTKSPGGTTGKLII